MRHAAHPEPERREEADAEPATPQARALRRKGDPPAGQSLDPASASLDELLAAIDVFVARKTAPPGGIDPVLHQLLQRFPQHAFPAEFVRRVAAKQDVRLNSTLRTALSKWPNEAVLAEAVRAFEAGDLTAGYVLASSAGERGLRLPDAFLTGLLGDQRVMARRHALALCGYAETPDGARICGIAERDPDPDTRSQALWRLGDLAESGRVQPQDVAGTILRAMRDPHPGVREAAANGLHLAGTEGARVALEILGRDGDVGESHALVRAAVSGGRAGDVLDLRLGPGVVHVAAQQMADVARAGRPEVLREAGPRLDEIVATFTGPEPPDAASSLFGALRDTGDARTVARYALARTTDPGTRICALAVLLEEPTTWATGLEIARGLVADRTEVVRVRLDALGLLDWDVPEGQDADAVRRATRGVLEEVLRGEKNERVRFRIEEQLRQQ